jgi:AcrR family transcriptional regulator
MFLKYGYRTVSARQVAARAGVDAAMVQYYFRSKRGLYLEMLESVIEPVRTSLERMAQAPDAEADVGHFLELFMRTAAANPWMPALLVREVLPAGAPFRNDYVEKLVRPMVARLLAAIERAQAQGLVARDAPPQFVLITMLSLGMWPFLVRPILPRAVGVTLDAEELNRLIAHTRGVLARGLRP